MFQIGFLTFLVLTIAPQTFGMSCKQKTEEAAKQASINIDDISQHDAIVDFTKFKAKDAAEAARHNQSVITQLEKLPVVSNSKRPTHMTKEQIEKLYRTIAEHPVVGLAALRKYDPSEVLSLCYGRAMAVHLEAIKMGLDQSSIKKIWFVGLLHNGAPSRYAGWAFHTSTIVRGPENRWWAVETWVAEVIKGTDPDKTNMIFVSKASRFTPRSDKIYARRYLQNEIFAGYFNDLLPKLERLEPSPEEGSP